MSMFTKGRWYPCLDGSVQIDDEYGRTIHKICIYDELDDDFDDEEETEVYVNTQLIAAAPEMYRLLKEVLKAPDFGYGLGFLFCQQIDELLDSIDGKEAEHD